MNGMTDQLRSLLDHLRDLNRQPLSPPAVRQLHQVLALLSAAEEMLDIMDTSSRPVLACQT